MVEGAAGGLAAESAWGEKAGKEKAGEPKVSRRLNARSSNKTKGRG